METNAPHDLGAYDRAASLPRLGGMARPDGVVVVSERFWAFAGTDGTLREGAMPAHSRAVRGIPLARGLARLAASLSPLFRRDGVARPRERLLLVFALLAPLGAVALPASLRTPAGIAITLGLVAWLLRGRTLNLHGAEHRAIAAAEERRLAATWAGEVRPSRFSRRCGTNFAVLVFPVALLLDWALDLPASFLSPLAVTIVSLALTMELWQLVQARGGALARIALAPGLVLQRATTREPSLAETRTALLAVESVLRREHADG